MKYAILHELPGRLRVKISGAPRDRRSVRAIAALLVRQEGLLSADLSPRTGNLLVFYQPGAASRRSLLDILEVLEPSDWEGLDGGFDHDIPPLFELALVSLGKIALVSSIRWLVFPGWVRNILNVCRALPRLAKGAGSLRRRRADIALLDGLALGILAWKREFSALRAILLLFSAADSLETWSRADSRAGLAESLAMKFDRAWIRTAAGDEYRPVSAIRPRDLVVVRTGEVIPIDGMAVEGEALVSQAALTGESEPAHKGPGITVFAGTAVAEGMLVIRAEKPADATRLWEIVRFIEESESLKGETASRAEILADAIVPYSLMLALTVFLFTRNLDRVASVLVVDYSCAIRISAPLTMLSAIREGIRRGVLLKGGRQVEAAAQADCLALDKTGTLTLAEPSVAKIAALGDWTEAEILRTTACIEEHFPHPVAKAVVREAERRGLRHRERHAEPEYILAHGVVSRLDGERVLVGSAHFVLDDNNVPSDETIRAWEQDEAALARSILYLAVGGRIVGAISIEDPIRPEAALVLKGFVADGIKQIVVLTGDGERTAQAVAGKLGVPLPRSGLLPADKAEIIQELKRDGRKVLFVGDGVNDSPALSAADVGAAPRNGADIAREVAGILLLDESLSPLLDARLLSRAALRRVDRQFGFIIGVNSILIGLGLAGLLSPATASFLHNFATLAVTVNSLNRLLPGGDGKP